jgi:hypothetical protein
MPGVSEAPAQVLRWGSAFRLFPHATLKVRDDNEHDLKITLPLSTSWF